MFLLDNLRGAAAVAGDELGADAQLLDLAQHRSGLGVHAAIHHHLGALGLDLGEDGHEIGGLVGGEFAPDHGAAPSLHGLLHLVGEALAVGRAVVDDGDLLAQVAGGVLADGQPLLHVVGDGAIDQLEALLGELGIGRGRGNHRDAGLVVNAGGGNGGAGVQVANHALDAGVTQALGHGGGGAGVGLVVLGHQLELDLLAVQGHALGVVVLDGHPGAILDVFAQVRLGAGEGGCHAELDHDFLGVGDASGTEPHDGQRQHGLLHEHSLQGLQDS